MRSFFVGTAVALLVSQATAWDCIGKDCGANQVAFSTPNLNPPASGWTWASCGDGSEIVTVESIEVSPDPPKPGQNLTVRAKGTIADDVADGTFADVIVKLGLIKLLTRRFDVCEEARANNADLQCPLGPGEYELTQTVALPREIPPAKFNVHVTGENQDSQPLLCLDLSINFMNR